MQDDMADDPLGKVPPCMRGKLDDREARNYQRYLHDLRQNNKSSAFAEEDMILFLKAQGAFFYSLDEVLSDSDLTEFKLADITETDDGKHRIDWAQAFIREKAPNFAVQGGRSADKVVKEFKVTEACMHTDRPIASINSEGQSSEAKKNIWPVDIFGIDLEDTKSSDVAHLLPAAPSHAVEWYDVACWAMGCDPSSVGWEAVFRLLHGTKSGKKRTHGAGLRHFVANKARINQPESLLDKTDPQMLILPIRSREQCLQWNGEDYDAIVLMGTNTDRKAYLWAVDAVGMTKTAKMKAVSHASEDELNLALTLMRQMTYALVQALVHLKPPEIPDNAAEDLKAGIEDAIKRRRHRIGAFTNLMRSKPVRVPKQKGRFPVSLGPFRGICKVSFSTDKGRELHRPPDPLLLVARAAVVFSVRQNFRLRASAIAENNYDWEGDALQFQALEQMDRRRELDSRTADGLQVGVAEDDNDDDGVSTISSLDDEGDLCSDDKRNIPSAPRLRDYHPAQLSSAAHTGAALPNSMPRRFPVVENVS